MTEPYPKADTLANCGGAVSMGQIGNDVSFFTNYVYIYIFFLFHLFEIPAENAGSRDECACRCSLGFFVSLFLFFRLVTERGRGSTGFSVLSSCFSFLVITTVLCTCIVLTNTILHIYVTLDSCTHTTGAFQKSSRSYISSSRDTVQ